MHAMASFGAQQPARIVPSAHGVRPAEVDALRPDAVRDCLPRPGRGARLRSLQ
jgi:hypothetical protein